MIFQYISKRHVANERQLSNRGTICIFSGVTGVWTNLDHICTVGYVEKIFPLNHFESKLPQSNPFRNTSVLNKSHFANYAQNRLPWPRDLKNRKKRSGSRKFTQIPFSTLRTVVILIRRQRTTFCDIVNNEQTASKS